MRQRQRKYRRRQNVPKKNEKNIKTFIQFGLLSHSPFLAQEGQFAWRSTQPQRLQAFLKIKFYNIILIGGQFRKPGEEKLGIREAGKRIREGQEPGFHLYNAEDILMTWTS